MTPTRIPGIAPPRKSLETETLAVEPKTIINTLGGIIVPMVEDAAVTATVKGAG